MAKPDREAKPKSVRPTPALLDLAELLVQEALMVPKNENRFMRAVDAPRAKPAVLERWEQEAATARLLTQPGAERLLLEFRHPDFEVDMTTGFDMDEGTLIDPDVMRLTGDRKRMSRVLKAWVEEMDDYDEDLVDALMGILQAGAGEDGDDEPDGADQAEGLEPREPTEDDRQEVQQIADALAGQYRRKAKIPQLTDDDKETLSRHAQMLWPILDGAIAACAARPVDKPLRQAWRDMLGYQLTNLRYDMDRGLEWAPLWVERCRIEMLGARTDGRLNPTTFAELVSAFGDARIELSDEAKKDLVNATLPTNPGRREAVADDNPRALLEKMAQTTDDPFLLIRGMSEAAHIMPSDVGQFLAHEFALSSLPLLRDAVPLLLLARDQGTRRSAATALEQIAAPDTLSPIALRRMIAIRNWLPPADRPGLDQAIRKARTANVPCAQWPTRLDTRMLVSALDGVGAVSLLFISKGTGRGTICGVLFKLGEGVADCWHGNDTPRASLRDMERHLIEEADASLVDGLFMDRMIQHAIARSVEVGNPPGVDLLQVAETVGGTDWQDRRIDCAAEAALLFEALPAQAKSQTAIAASLRRSGAWFDRERFTESWYLDDPQSRKAVIATRRLPQDQAVDQMVKDLMPEYRAEWLERMVLLALRAGSAVDTLQRKLAPDFVILAHALAGSGPMGDIPLIRRIAHLSVTYGRLAR